MNDRSGNRAHDLSGFRFLYRDPDGFYRLSDKVTKDDCVMVSPQVGDAYLKSLGLNLEEVGFGYVIMPQIDLAQSAYDRLLKLDDIDDRFDRASEVEAINMTIAICMGYRVQMAETYSPTTITVDRFAKPYGSEKKFERLPDYQGEISAAMTVAPEEWNLNLEQDGDIWRAVYRHRTTKSFFGHQGKLVRAVLLSALTTLIKPR
jgi:hypothetical protein